MNKLVAEARAELVRPSVRPLYDQIQQDVYQQSPFIVTTDSPYLYGVGNWVRGFPRDTARQLRPVPRGPDRQPRTDRVASGRFGFVRQRLIQLPFLVIGITIITFLLIRLIPGNPAS